MMVVYRGEINMKCFIRDFTCFTMVVDPSDKNYYGAGVPRAALQRMTRLRLFDEEALEECMELVHVPTLDDHGHVYEKCQRSTRTKTVHL